MNPLEDNLTSRHKRNKSSLFDNRMSQATTATANSQTNSKAEDPLISPPRTVPFMHTRNSSHDNITNVSHPNASPRVSRTDLAAPFYDQPPAHRSSRTEIQEPFYKQPVSQRSSRINLQSQYHDSPPSHRSSHPLSMTYRWIKILLSKWNKPSQANRSNKHHPLSHQVFLDLLIEHNHYHSIESSSFRSSLVARQQLDNAPIAIAISTQRTQTSPQ